MLLYELASIPTLENIYSITSKTTQDGSLKSGNDISSLAFSVSQFSASIVRRQLRKFLNRYSNHRYLKVMWGLSFKSIKWLPRVEGRYG